MQNEKNQFENAKKRVAAGTAKTIKTEKTAKTAKADISVLKQGIVGIAYTGMGYLLGGCRLWFGTYPLGFAMMCAVPAKALFTFAGLAASALTRTDCPGILISVHLVTLVLRILSGIIIDNSYFRTRELSAAEKIRLALKGLFGENIYLRMTTSAVAAFGFSLYRIVSGGYHYYDLFGAVFGILLAPAATVAFCYFFEKEKYSRPAKYVTGCAAMLASLTFAARDMTVLGFSPAAFGGLFAVFYICLRRGILASSAAGFICGIAFEPIYAPAFVFAAIICGLLRRFSLSAAVITSVISGMMWGFYIDGTDVMTKLLPAFLLSGCAFLGASKAGWICPSPAAVMCGKEQEKSLDLYAELEKARAESDEKRMTEIATGFGSLSRVFYNLSDRLRRPGILDLRRICDSVFDCHCPACPKHDICWKLEYGTSLDMISRLSSSLNENGRADSKCLPGEVVGRCTDIDSICDEINARSAVLTEAIIKSEKIGVFALDYGSIAHILTDAVEEQKKEYACSEELTRKAEKVFDDMGAHPRSLLVYGGRCRCVAAKGLDSQSVRADFSGLRMKIGEAVGAIMEEPLFKMGEDGMSVMLKSRRKFAVSEDGICMPCDEGGVCGDSICMFENEKDYFYAIISDGMGTGSEAAFSSGLATMFLEKMLKAGNGSATSIKMLNGVLRSRGGAREMECSATVDMLSVDLMTGEASVIKSGAAPTYVRRKGDIFRLHSETVPLGILNSVDAKKTVLELEEGDVIVMVSDGVSDAVPGQGEWLADILGYEWEDNLGLMAKKITSRAQSLGSMDDVSAVLVKIEKY